jgi:hypothetical protein
MSAIKDLYVIFFSGEGVAIKVPVKNGKIITGKYYKDVVLEKLKKYSKTRCHVTAHTKTKRNCFASPRILQTLPHVILFVSETEILHCWAEIQVRHLDLQFISTLLLCPNQRTVMHTSAETLHFKPRGVLRGHEMTIFELT